MSGSDADDSEGDDSAVVWFLYTGQARSDIPRDITHLGIDPSVKIIPASFQGNLECCH